MPRRPPRGRSRGKWMRFYWSASSVPGLRDLPPAVRRRVWREALDRAGRGRARQLLTRFLAIFVIAFVATLAVEFSGRGLATRVLLFGLAGWGLGLVLLQFEVRAALPHIRELAPGRCQACGYDLTANASGRCPECGAEVPAVAAEPRA